MSAKVLIVEDEVKIADVLSDYLSQAGYATHHIDNGLEALAGIRIHQPDVILLDVMLPGKDGMDICRELRAFSQTPVIMITARIEEIDRLLGLELGADDYICKPFSPREVVARVKALLRRARPGKMPTNTGLKLDPGAYRAYVNDHDLQLTAVEYKLLEHLAEHPGRIYSRSQLMDHIYPDQRIVSDRTIDSHIKKLRKKIARLSPETELIHSVYGVGYRFELL